MRKHGEVMLKLGGRDGLEDSTRSILPILLALSHMPSPPLPSVVGRARVPAARCSESNMVMVRERA